jgi:hypothetical protein
MGAVPRIGWNVLMGVNVRGRELVSRVGIVGYMVYWGLFLITIPMNLLHNTIRSQIRDSVWLGAYVDVWILFWASANLVFVMPHLAEATGWSLLLVLIPIIRVLDMLRVLFWTSLIQRDAPRMPSNAILQLLIHYVEVATAFSCIYLFLQSYYGIPVLSVGDIDRFVSSWEAFYFSVVTAATLGYGDISPSLNSSTARFIGLAIVAELMVVLSLALIAIPRYLAYLLPRSRTDSQNAPCVNRSCSECGPAAEI